jgi:hypothetical protein
MFFLCRKIDGREREREREKERKREERRESNKIIKQKLVKNAYGIEK